MDCIKDAFCEWLKEQSTMPTPSDVRKIAIQKLKLQKDEHGFIPATPAKRTKYDRVEWYGMPWATIQKDANMVEKVNAHLALLRKEKGAGIAEGYLLYLKSGPQNHKPQKRKES